jgi:hypothetical protein
MRLIIFSLAVIVLVLLYSCTKTVTKTVTDTDTVTVTKIDTLIKIKLDSNINLDSGLVAYYPFNGNANDASGNGLNGTITGGVTFTNDVAGNASSAATFDGSTGYIIVPDNAGKFQNYAVTVSFLVKAVTPSVRQAFISNTNYTDGTGLSYAVNVGSAGPGFPDFGVVTNTLGCGLPVSNAADNIATGNAMLANTWYNYTCIFTDSLQAIFVNGTLNTAVTRDFPTLNKCANTQTLLIGTWWSGDPILFNGSMDEIRIYNRALNQNEIIELAKAVQ